MSRKEKILIVDDEPRNVKLLKAMLVFESFELASALSGEEALEKVETFEPDLLLLDVMMPGMSGFDVCRRLKGEERTRAIPVLIVTALHEKSHRIQAMEAGADDFLSKPVDQIELVIRVKSLLRIKRYHDELLSSNKDLGEKNRKLQETEKAKEDLIHMIIHDLKNPLNALRGFIDLLLVKEDQLPAEQVRHVKRAMESCRDMAGQIDGLLTVHRMDQTGWSPLRTRVDLAAAAARVVEEFKMRAEFEGISLSMATQEDLPHAALDRGLVERVMANLLSNAIRHTPAGGSVTVRLGSHPGDGKLWVFVEDTGEGLPREYLEKVFEKFEQARLRGEDIKVGASGLGLAFCKMAVEAHGGRIWVESKGSGKGSVFCFTLPLQAPNDGGLKPVASNAKAP